MPVRPTVTLFYERDDRLILVGTGAKITVGQEGPGHYSVDALAWARLENGAGLMHAKYLREIKPEQIGHRDTVHKGVSRADGDATVEQARLEAENAKLRARLQEAEKASEVAAENEKLKAKLAALGVDLVETDPEPAQLDITSMTVKDARALDLLDMSVDALGKLLAAEKAGEGRKTVIKLLTEAIELVED